MSDEIDADEIEERKAALRSVYQSVPALDPPQDWAKMMRDVYEEMGLRGLLSGLPRSSPDFKLYSERLAEFMGVTVDELELTNE